MTLEEALERLAKMRYPSVEKILRNNGYDVEADAVKEVLDAYKEQQ
jgi:hypothetical protein